MKIEINLRAFLSLCWLLLFLIITLLLTPIIFSADPIPEEEQATAQSFLKEEKRLSDSTYIEISQGKKLFKGNCAACHNRNMKDPMTGPALGGVVERWANFPPQDLFQWIRNSQGMIHQKHPRAMALWKEWEKRTMNAFPNMTDEDIRSILAYVESK